jgi:hypothetical protein
LLLGLGAPTPGAVGSCGGDDLSETADLQSYCIAREDLVCVRRGERGELSAVGVDKCRRDALEVCPRRWWSPECRPTEREARACLNALRSLDTLSTPEGEIEECQVSALCRARESTPIANDPGAAGTGAT